MLAGGDGNDTLDGGAAASTTTSARTATTHPARATATPSGSPAAPAPTGPRTTSRTSSPSASAASTATATASRPPPTATTATPAIRPGRAEASATASTRTATAATTSTSTPTATASRCRSIATTPTPRSARRPGDPRQPRRRELRPRAWRRGARWPAGCTNQMGARRLAGRGCARWVVRLAPKGARVTLSCRGRRVPVQAHAAADGRARLARGLVHEGCSGARGCAPVRGSR